jgi:hypothetical protein
MDEIETKPSRALPIGVAAGLAVAVFGVLFALRGSGDATTTTTATTAGETPPAETPPAEKPAETPPPPPAEKPAETPPPPEQPVAAATPDAQAATTGTTTGTTTTASATPDAAAAAAPSEPPPSDKKTAVLMITVSPADVRADVKVAGKDILGERVELPIGTEPVKVEVRARGYVAFEQDVVPDKDHTIAVELKKEGAVATATPTPTEKPATTTTTKPATTTTKKPARRPSRPRVDL